MDIVVFALVVLTAAFALIAFLEPAARWLHVPVPVALAVVGLVIGLGIRIGGVDPLTAFGDGEAAVAFSSLGIGNREILLVFLPPLLFEMTLTLDVRRLREYLPAVAIMAVVAVVAATLAVGAALNLTTGLPLILCLLLGATVSTTDPAAVISTFRGIGATQRQLVVIEGESLLNDAAAIALFAILAVSVRDDTPLSVVDAVEQFLFVFAVGAAVGGGLGYGAARLYPLLRGSVAAETTLTMALVYAVYLVSEVALGASGVVAVVTAGLVTKIAGSVRMGPRNWGSVAAVWAQVGYWANNLILLIAAVLVPHLLTIVRWFEIPMILIMVIAAFAARAAVVFGLLTGLEKLRLVLPIGDREKLLILWGGVRGAVTLVLVFGLAETRGVGDMQAALLAALGCGFVFFTLLVNATTLGTLTRRLGLDRLSDGERALRASVVAGTMREALDHVLEVAREHETADAATRPVVARYRRRIAEMEKKVHAPDIAFGERLRAGLAILANQERRIVKRQFETEVIGPATMRALRTVADRLADVAHYRGREGYAAVVAGGRQYGPLFRLALEVNARVGISAPLRQLLGRRFQLLFESDVVLRALLAFHRERMAGLIGVDAAANLDDLLVRRQQGVQRALKALELQYPSYAAALRQQFLLRAGLRRELGRYERLLAEGVIGPELFASLAGETEAGIRETRRRPPLDPELDRPALFARLPMLQGLAADEERAIRRLLRTRLVAPDEHIVRAGERGTAMYLIASGAVEVRNLGAPILLGTGDFFGELSILAPTRRRKSDIVALSYCRLLVLSRRDFRKLVTVNPGLEARIRAAASEQLGRGFHHATPEQVERFAHELSPEPAAAAERAAPAPTEPEPATVEPGAAPSPDAIDVAAEAASGIIIDGAGTPAAADGDEDRKPSAA
jgi:monovalent cation:H+ antiporter, CPA1 family